jgi:4-hydroxythreonine-4-phosphate dehydrogenase
LSPGSPPNKKKSAITVIVGDRKLLERGAQVAKVKLDKLNVMTRAKRSVFQPGAVNLIQVKAPAPREVKAGEPDAKTGRAAMAFLEKATELALLNEVDAIVTAPISKAAINNAGFYFTGHTEYFARRTNTAKYAMCFYADKIRVALVTDHIPLRKVHSKAKLARVIRTAALLDEFIRDLEGKRPFLAITGVNPHAGEDGLLGVEEVTEIAPAAEACRKQGIKVEGPVSAEMAFINHLAGKYDGVVAMFHDQGLLPLKVLAPFKTVNVTLGLPFIRTSVGHGAANDIAGKGIAKVESLHNAVALAVKLAKKKWRE